MRARSGYPLSMGRGDDKGGGSATAIARSDPESSWTARFRNPLIAVGAIALATVLIYGQILEHDFVDYDDYGYFVQNPYLDGRLDISDFIAAFANNHEANWSPLTSISILLGDAVHGPDPSAHLMANLFFHFLCSALLFLALLKMTGRFLASACVGLFFAVHPLHVESVAWASERKDVLAGTFWMACLLGYGFYCERPSRLRYGVVVLLGTLAGLSKPTAVGLPLTLLLLDYWPLGRLAHWRDLPGKIWEKWPLFTVMAGVAILTLRAQTEAGANLSQHWPWALRGLNAGLSYWTYIGQTLWPWDLTIFYPYPDRNVLLGWTPFAAWLAGLSFTVLAFKSAYRRPYLAMGWVWFTLTLVPMIGFIQVGGQAHADRYMYVPMVGLLIVLSWTLADWAEKSGAGRPIWLGAMIVVLVFGTAAWRQAGYWRNTLALFEHAIEVVGPNPLSHRSLGVAYWTQGDFSKGEEHLRAAVKLSPTWGDARLALADALNQSGRHRGAREHLLLALEHGSDRGSVHAGLGVAAQGLGEERNAAIAYRRAIKDGLLDWEIYNNLAWLLATTREPGLRDPANAILLAQRALALAPENSDVIATLETAYVAAGQHEAANAVRNRIQSFEATPGDPAEDEGKSPAK